MFNEARKSLEKIKRYSLPVLVSLYCVYCTLNPRQESNQNQKPDISMALDSVLRVDGGFTYDDNKEVLLKDKKVFIVSVKGFEEKVKAQDVSIETIINYYRKHFNQLSKPNVHFGAWLDTKTDIVHFDASFVFFLKEEAEDFARKNGQIAYYDLGEGKDVEVTP